MEIDRIYNDDCYKAIKNIPDKSIDCVYVDIPYKYNMQKRELTNLKSQDLSCKRYNNELIDCNLAGGVDYNIYAEFIRVLKKPNVFIWLSRDQIYDTLKWFHDNTKCRFQILVWCKTNPFPACNGNWLSDIEYCIHFYDGIKLNPGIRHKHKFYVSATNANGKKKYHHPTVKPLELVKMHLEHASQPNDIVLDCFIGSGTTAVACKELGRHFIGYEINKDYYQIAIDRLNGIDKSGQLTI